jgi:hypothetical protein
LKRWLPPSLLVLAMLAAPAQAASLDWCKIVQLLPHHARGIGAFEKGFARASGCRRSTWVTSATEWFCKDAVWTFRLTPAAADGVLLTAKGFSPPPVGAIERCNNRAWKVVDRHDPGMILFRGEIASQRGLTRLAVLGPVEFGQSIVRLSVSGSPRRDWSANDGSKAFVSTPVGGVRSAVRLAGTDPTLVTEDQLMARLAAEGARIVYRPRYPRLRNSAGDQWNIDVSPPTTLAGVERIYLYFRIDRLQNFAYRITTRTEFDRRIAALNAQYGPGKKQTGSSSLSVSWDERVTNQGVMRITAIIYGYGTAQESYSINYLNPIVAAQLDPVRDYEWEQNEATNGIIATAGSAP